MTMIITLLIGTLGGAMAFLLNLPIPWLVGSLLVMLLCRKVKSIKAPPKVFSRWMRVVLGIALGAAVAQSLKGFNQSFVSLLFVVVAFVCFVTVAGYYYFKRLPGFSNVDSFMSSLPGGLTFLMSLSDDLGDRFPKIALIHTIRMVFLILCFSLFAYIAGVEEASTSIDTTFAITLDPLLWQVFAFAFVMGAVSDRLNIAGGHIMFPMIASAVFYAQGWIVVPVPEVLQTLAMITFGVGIGCKLNNVSLHEFKPYVKASLLFTVFAMAIALFIAVGLGSAFNMHYFLFFLALAPGSIAEISLIAIALGFDVGLVAVVHTCRYLFIMFIGSIGMNFLLGQETQKSKNEISA